MSCLLLFVIGLSLFHSLNRCELDWLRQKGLRAKRIASVSVIETISNGKWQICYIKNVQLATMKNLAGE